MIGSATRRIRRARLVPVALTSAALSSAVLAASVTGTLSAFQASITNSSNTAATGALTMRETGPDGTTTCLSSSGANNSYTQCDTIDKYGGTGADRVFAPGTTRTTTITIENTGPSAVSTFKLTPDVCERTASGTQSSTGDLCSSLRLSLMCESSASPAGRTTTLLYNAKPLSELGEVAIPQSCIPAPNAGTAIPFTFELTLPDTQDNTVQGQQVSQRLKWTFTGA